MLHLLNEGNVLVRVEISEHLYRVIAAGRGHLGKDQPVAHIFTVLKLRFE
ncbi:hypothetical protein SDC9_204447 [bioreactor metagenome]|uniref:Uncharacterized protein n=1 Tax=bioreactor metagenome TaxID=1076179 RepID=A0A645IZ90_9ZZZZ